MSTEKYKRTNQNLLNANERKSTRKKNFTDQITLPLKAEESDFLRRISSETGIPKTTIIRKQLEGLFETIEKKGES